MPINWTRIAPPFSPLIRAVNLWFWQMVEIPDCDRHLQGGWEKFPGKPILQGIFLHSCSYSNRGMPARLLPWQLDKIREYMTAGVIEGAVISGGREIRRWPESSAAAKDYRLRQ